jgi:hypothetical protein
MGVLSALPFVSAANLCCCLWVVGGGIVAAYVLQQNESASITPADGALVGLFAGLLGAVIQVLVSIPITFVVAPMERALLQRVIDMAGTMPEDMRQMVEQYSRGGESIGFTIVARAVAFVFWLCVGAVFSTVGGLIGAAVFRKQMPPGTIDITPPLT